MTPLLAAARGDAGTALGIGLVLTAAGLGFRHGIDWDHLAALGDITSSQERSRRAMALATLYALGHALVVVAFGLAAILLAARVPPSVDGVMARVVGATLVLLGLVVVVGLVRHGRDFRMRSRGTLVVGAIRRARRRWRRRSERVVVIEHEHEHEHDQDGGHGHGHGPGVGLVAGHVHARLAPDHDPVGGSGAPPEAPSQSTPAPARLAQATHSHRHRHVGTVPDDPFDQYGPATAFGVGLVHGIGGETPTQVLIFLTAAGVSGRLGGVLLLACFVVGLLASNTAVAVATRLGVLGASRSFVVYAATSLLVAAFSVVVGVVMLAGGATALPSLLGG